MIILRFCSSNKSFLKSILVVVFVCGFFLNISVSSVYAGWLNIEWGKVLGNSLVQYVVTKEYLKYEHFHNSKGIMNNYKREYGVNNDHIANDQLNMIMNNLLSAIPEKKNPQYSWFVNNKEDFNAFCGIGHNVSVNIGAFKFLNYNEDELAAVLAHELVHGEKSHSLSGLEKILPIAIAQQIYVTKNHNDLSQIMSALTGRYLVAKQATLPQEWEADNLAFEIWINAGYNPGAGAAIWSKVKDKHGDNRRNFFGEIISPNDHPTNSQRIENYSAKLTAYSNNIIKVQGSTVYVNDIPFVTPTASNGMKSEERAFFVAGNLAIVLHTNPRGEKAYVNDDSQLMMGSKTIMTPSLQDVSVYELADKLNDILGYSS